MGDQNDGGALLSQRVQYFKQLLGLLRRQHCGGLVQNQNFGSTVQRLQNLQPLTVTYRQVTGQRVKLHMQPGGLHQFDQTGTDYRSCPLY